MTGRAVLIRQLVDRFGSEAFRPDVEAALDPTNRFAVADRSVWNSDSEKFLPVVITPLRDQAAVEAYMSSPRTTSDVPLLPSGYESFAVIALDEEPSQALVEYTRTVTTVLDPGQTLDLAELLGVE